MEKIEVVAGVLYSEGHFLVAQRKKRKNEAWNGPSDAAQRWEFPGGKVENESKEDALIRELYEELGIRVEVIEEICKISHSYFLKSSNTEMERKKEYEIHFFYSKIKEGKPRAIECEQVAWVTPAQLDKLELLDADKKALP
ncbi:MAG: (deoxy)nucleoside triphosphate pyrophosphohydrolase, partial [Thermoplasmata archaeon]